MTSDPRLKASYISIVLIQIMIRMRYAVIIQTEPQYDREKNKRIL